VVAIATDSPVLDKLISNLEEIKARGARVIAVGTEGDCALVKHADEIITVPGVNPIIGSILAVVPLQLLAYRIARERGLDLDQPRNLAKPVTVE
jgi:glutamine---fructose-6-phosphate transaminase (isomerizing)